MSTRGVRGLNGRLLRPDLALAAERRAHLGERRLEALDLGGGGAQIGALLVDELLGDGVGPYQCLVALEVGLDLVAGRLGVREISLGLVNLGRLAARLEIGELLLGLAKLPRRLLAGGEVGGVVLLEQRRARRHLGAAPHRERHQEALLGRSDLDEIGLGITLPLQRRRGAIEPPPGAAGTCENDQRENRHLATGHRSSPWVFPLT